MNMENNETSEDLKTDHKLVVKRVWRLMGIYVLCAIVAPFIYEVSVFLLLPEWLPRYTVAFPFWVSYGVLAGFVATAVAVGIRYDMEIMVLMDKVERKEKLKAAASVLRKIYPEDGDTKAEANP